MQGTLGSFGDLIAFVLPGLVLLIALAPLSPTLKSWLGRAEQQPAVGGAVLLLILALGTGILVDALRAQTVDRIHLLTGVKASVWNLNQLDEAKFAQFEAIIENYYRFHQFYGNLFVAVLAAYAVRLGTLKRKPWPPSPLDAGVVVVLGLAWLGSRSDLQSCYVAISELTGSK